MTTLTRVWYVVAGFLAVVLLSVATDALLEKLAVFPPQSTPEAYVPWMLAVALLYRSVYAIVGGYVTARLASHNPNPYLRALMVLGLLGGVAGIVAGWSFGNHWYPIALAVSGPVLVWLGGKFASKHA